jgi:hypothetical protein
MALIEWVDLIAGEPSTAESEKKSSKKDPEKSAKSSK